MKTTTAKLAADTTVPFLTHQENRTIRKALDILEARFFEQRIPLTRPEEVADFLRLQLAGNKHEVFAVIFLDTLNLLISFEEMFYGSINSCSLHPREIVKSALAHNATAVILCHNRPSG